MLGYFIAKVVAVMAAAKFASEPWGKAQQAGGIGVLARARAELKRFSSWLRYELLYSWPGRKGVAALNVGLLPVDPAVEAAAAAESRMTVIPCNLQVYHEVALRVQALADIRPDMAAIEVGSGRGGGLAYLNGVLPFSVKGFERSAAGVRFARRRGIDSMCGSVTRMPFPSASLDMAFSVEMLFIFGETDQAFAELARVLKPGGRIVAADFRPWKIGRTRAHVQELAARHGFTVASFEDLTGRARRSIVEGEPQRRAFLDKVPRFLQRDMPDMFSLEGTPRYQSWVEGRRSYFLTVLERLP